jgi:hypothetical protein
MTLTLFYALPAMARSHQTVHSRTFFLTARGLMPGYI